jgi:CheY-like chemotaxis protein
MKREDEMKTTTILLIDQDAVNHILVSEALSGRDVQIVHVDNGREAIDLFQYNPFFDIVITEMLLPDMDGFGVLREIRKLNPIVPVIAQSAYISPELKARCSEEGFNYFIEKPSKVEVIVDQVDVYKDFVNI